MSWTRPTNLARRPVAILGGGFQGRRIAFMWGSQGRPVVVYDKQRAALNATAAYYEEQTKQHTLGRLSTTSSLSETLSKHDPWLIIEAVPEILSLKRDTFATLERDAPRDAILATNSSSYKSSEIIQGLSCGNRALNIHYFRPPEIVSCEVMTSGSTQVEVIDTVVEQLRLHGHTPFLARRESSGFIHNRVWAAIKREALQVVAEGVANPEDVDALFRARFKTPQGPFEIMDGVGLDVVLDIENHYAEERPHLPISPRQLLERYKAAGRLGIKTGQGFYDWSATRTVSDKPSALAVL
ncbi:hypothetical protein JCM10207_003281 [Rhodosporidiobolus poonsookiae]